MTADDLLQPHEKKRELRCPHGFDVSAWTLASHCTQCAQLMYIKQLLCSVVGHTTASDAFEVGYLVEEESGVHCARIYKCVRCGALHTPGA